MGSRGPKKKPSEIERLQGNPGRRKSPTREPKPKGKTPRCPSWLNKHAKAEYRRITPILEECGLATPADLAALAMYCDAWSRFRELRELVDESGYLCESEKGGMYQHPYVGAMNKAFDQVLRVAAQFGMTPSARASLNIGGKGEESDDPLESFLKTIHENRDNAFVRSGSN